MPALRIVLGTHVRIELTGHAPPAGQLQLGGHRATAVFYVSGPDGGPGSQLTSDAPDDSTAISSIPKSRSRSSSPYSWAWSRTSPTSTVWLGPDSRAIPSKADSTRSLSRPRRMIRY